MTQEEKLLSDLVECRWFVMRELADLAEEKGDERGARAWRWLADNKRWPEITIQTRTGRQFFWSTSTWTRRESSSDEAHHLPPRSSSTRYFDDLGECLLFARDYLASHFGKQNEGGSPKKPVSLRTTRRKNRKAADALAQRTAKTDFMDRFTEVVLFRNERRARADGIEWVRRLYQSYEMETHVHTSWVVVETAAGGLDLPDCEWKIRTIRREEGVPQW